jgi:hypothetical protein
MDPRKVEHNHGHTHANTYRGKHHKTKKVTTGRNMIDLRTRNVAYARTLLKLSVWVGLGDAPKRQGHLAGVSVCTCM